MGEEVEPYKIWPAVFVLQWVGAEDKRLLPPPPKKIPGGDTKS